jgi:hypothetical protein
MQSTQTLPPEYQEVGTFDLRNNPQAMLRLNLWGFVLFAVSSWFFTFMLGALRPDDAGSGLALAVSGLNGGWQLVLAIILLTGLMIVLHEAVHGIFFYAYTRSMPKFAFRGVYAFAAAPGWYLPKAQYLVVALAPLVLLSLLGLVLMAVIPAAGFLGLLFFLVTNASGAVGDLWVAVWLLRQPRDCYANDAGDAVTLYVKGPPPSPRE